MSSDQHPSAVTYQPLFRTHQNLTSIHHVWQIPTALGTFYPVFRIEDRARKWKMDQIITQYSISHLRPTHAGRRDGRSIDLHLHVASMPRTTPTASFSGNHQQRTTRVATMHTDEARVRTTHPTNPLTLVRVAEVKPCLVHTFGTSYSTPCSAPKVEYSCINDFITRGPA